MKRFGVVVMGTLLAAGLVAGAATSASAAKKPPSTAPTVNSVTPNDGPTSGGTSVVIKGKNIVGATAVDFGGTAAESFFVKGRSLVATAPPGNAGPVDVTVTANSQTSATSSADLFTYEGVGPTVQNVTPRSGADTGGTKVTIAGSDFLTATEVEFGTTSVPFTIDSNGAISTVSPSEPPGKVDVTVTGTDGTSPTNAADVFTFAVRVPIITMISPTSGPAGTQVTITGSRFAKKGTTVDFGGTPATNVTVVSGSEITADAPSNSGTVDISVTDAKGTSSSSSADQFTYTSPAS